MATLHVHIKNRTSILAFVIVLFSNFFASGFETSSCNPGSKISNLNSIEKDFAALHDVTKKAIIECQAKHDAVDSNDWDRIIKAVWQNNLLRNENPGGQCFERSEILSRELDKMGYHSKKIYLGGDSPGESGFILAPLKTQSGFQALSFSSHMANVVSKKNSDGSIEDYIFDPMFSDGPMKLRDYIEMIRVPNSGDPPKHRIIGQTQSISISNGRIISHGVGCQYSASVLNDSIEKARLNFENKKETQTLSQRVSLPTWERAKTAYQYFYGMYPQEKIEISPQAEEDIRSTFQNLPEKTRANALKNFSKFLDH